MLYYILFFLSTHLIAQTGDLPSPSACAEQLTTESTAVNDELISSLSQNHSYHEFVNAQRELSKEVPGSYTFHGKFKKVQSLVSKDEVTQVLNTFQQRIDALLRGKTPQNPEQLASNKQPGVKVIFSQGVPVGLKLPVTQLLSITPQRLKEAFPSFSHLELENVTDEDMDRLCQTETHRGLLQQLSSLSIVGTGLKFRDRGLETFAKSFFSFSSLETLSIKGSFDDEGVKILADKFDLSRIRTLSIDGLYGTFGVHSILSSSLGALQALHLIWRKQSYDIFTPKLRRFSKERYPKLQSLMLSGSCYGPDLFDRFDRDFVSNIKNLIISSDFTNSYGMTENDTTAFFCQLETLCIDGLYTHDEKSALQRRFPSLKPLSLCNKNPESSWKAIMFRNSWSTLGVGDADFFIPKKEGSHPPSYIVW